MADYKGTLVAVKKIRSIDEEGPEKEIKSVIDEVKVAMYDCKNNCQLISLRKIGHHDNVITLFGLCIDPLCLVMGNNT